MDISLRSILTAGISTVTATTLVFAPSVQPPPPPERTVQLTAAVQPLAPQEPLLSVLLTSPLRLLGPAVTPGTLPPAPAPLAIPIAPNLANTIDNTYLAVEPWVRYGFQVAADVLGWVPYVGWLSGQIMVFYTFGEGIVQSARIQLHRLAPRARRRHRERGRLRRGRRCGIHLAGNRRVELLPAAVAAAAVPDTATTANQSVRGPPAGRHADGPNSARRWQAS